MLSSQNISHLLHDLKIPLHVITGYLSLLKESKLDDQQQEDLSGIENNIHFLTRLVADLRVLFQEEALEPRLEHGDVVKLVKEEVSFFERAYGIEVECHLPPSLSTEIDGHFLRRILSNLLENGCRHSPPSSLLSLKVDTDQRGWRLCLSNPLKGEIRSGEYEPLEKIHQRDGTTPTGLGLAVVRTLTQLLKGKVSISKEENTMEITILFPFRKDRE